DGARQLWVRRDGDSPWLMDLAMTPHDGDTWISPRDERIRRPFDDATFVAGDGIRYLRPELVLFMKARFARASGERDFATILPMLEPERRDWLREAIALLYRAIAGSIGSGREGGLGRRLGRRRLGSIDVAGPEVLHELDVTGQPPLVADRPEAAAGEALVPGQGQLRAQRGR